MKKILILSFDYHNKIESKHSFAVMNIVSYLESNFNVNISIDTHSFDMSTEATTLESQFDVFLCNNNMDYDYVAISLYTWSKKYVNNLVDSIKSLNKKVKIVFGGYEIRNVSESELESLYPNTDFFIRGYAEEAIVQLLNGTNEGRHLEYEVKKTHIKPIYFNNLKKTINYKRLSIESKRGCLFNCSFCAHKDHNKDFKFEKPIQTVIKDLEYINNFNVSKINFVDPVFNIGNSYLEILERLVEINFMPIISLQVRFEFIKGEKGKRFLELISKLNVILEFGLQTINEIEMKEINRRNDKNHISRVMSKLNHQDVNYEVSLIYGLPEQTVASFEENIRFLEEEKCNNIVAYPLMLLTGTQLYDDKDKYFMVEEEMAGINYVVQSNSFNRDDYDEMNQMAERLAS